MSRTVEGNPQRLNSTNTISLFSETTTKKQFFSKETPFQQNQINTNYLLAGAGAIIFMLLIIIVIQTIKKSKSANRNSSHKHKSTEKQTCDEALNRPPNGHKMYLNLTPSKQSKQFYQPMDPVYHEIDESVELMQIPASTDTTMEFGDQNLPKCICNTINVTKNDDFKAQTSKSFAIPGTCPDTDKADYLQPVFVHANIEIESKQETHSYVDMTG